MTAPPRAVEAIDAGVLFAVVGLLAVVAWLGHDAWQPFTPETIATLDLSPARLPYYAGRSLLRMFAALGASLGFTLVVGTWAARSRRAAWIIVPALDVLQSVPVLGFLSATVTFFMALAPGRVLGLELASIFAIFTGQVWNLTFAFYHSLLTLPRDQAEAVRLYRLSAWQRFSHFEVPAAVIPLVWNGMMSFGGGWFFLAASEAITVTNRDLLLPGIGSYLAVAVRAGDLHALGWALLTMTAMILLVDRGFWRPLVAWAERFKLEESRGAGVPRSGVLDLLRRSRIASWLGARLARADELVDRLGRRWARSAPRPPDPAPARATDTLFGLTVWAVLGTLAVWGALFIASAVPITEGLRVMGLGVLTLGRVLLVLALSAAVWTPVGVWIGLDPAAARVARPVAQILASFPANALFPLVTIVFLRWHFSLEWGAAGLMALGAQWYLLFNTIAGAMAIPNDLREMTVDLGIRGWLRWRTLILPAIFPAWITGALTAAGGAWNASIVAEVVTWGETRLTAHGLGAYITQATTAGDAPRVVLGVAAMSAYVVALDHLAWRPLERLAERRFRLG
jgi:NitT/TauT family transport system permease protein